MRGGTGLRFKFLRLRVDLFDTLLRLFGRDTCAGGDSALSGAATFSLPRTLFVSGENGRPKLDEPRGRY